MNMEKGNLKDFENSNKINENSYNDNFLAVVIRRKRKFIFTCSKKRFLGLVAVNNSFITGFLLNLSLQACNQPWALHEKNVLELANHSAHYIGYKHKP